MKIQWIVLLFILINGCSPIDSTNQEVAVTTASKTFPKEETDKKSSTQPIQIDRSQNNLYPWLTDYKPEEALLNQIPTPKGYTRMKLEVNSFADWIQHLPLKEKSAPVELFNGSLKGNQSVHHRVVDIDIGKRDLQQCADAVMRLKAEYHFSKKEFEKIHFNYTSGNRVSFDDWRKGRKPKVEGNKVNFYNSTDQTSPNNSYANFKKYLTQIFNYAGTASLTKELQKVSIDDLQIGDVFIQGGFPGHAVIVVDLAQNENGERLFLLAQSYMPAQNIHLLKNPNNDDLNPWYSTDIGEELITPEWSFVKSDLKRFQD